MSPPVARFRSESGQALILLLGMAAALMVGSLFLVGFGQALGGRSEQQRGADLAALSAALSMRDDYPRLLGGFGKSAERTVGPGSRQESNTGRGDSSQDRHGQTGGAGGEDELK